MRYLIIAVVLLIALIAWLNAETANAPVDLFPAQLIDAAGEATPRSALDGKIVGVYFSASWCPPCRAFTPTLVTFRDQHQDEFEVVFVSADRNAADQQTYMNEYQMGFLAVPFGSPAGKALSERFSVRGIPKLVILDAAGNVITENGRGELSTDPAGALAAWKRKSS